MNFLVIVLSSQLLYYLLIAQTGIVGAFHSHIHDLYTLPIGGVLGALFSAYWRHHGIRQELCFLFGAQMILSWFYPHYSLGMILVLGFVVGYTTPLMIYVFGSQKRLHLAFGLGIAYAVGTALYTYPFAQRDVIAVVLPLISVVALRFARLGTIPQPEKREFDTQSVAVMMLWIFADSALFETLSRSGAMDIWSHHTVLIIVSHLLGVVLAYLYGKELLSQTRVIWTLFAASYLLYWLKAPILLSVIYPIVISYYNVLLFQKLIGMRDIRLIALSMVGVGWIAASAANGVALSQQLWLAALVLVLFAMTYSLLPWRLKR